MNGIIIGILIAAAIGGFVFWRIYARNKKKADNAWKADPFGRALRIINSTTPAITPNGHKVYFETGTDPATFSLPACDVGVGKTFEKAECVPYPVDRSVHRISIVVFRAEQDSQGDPAYRVFISHTNPYYQSEWDKGGKAGLEVDHYVLAAAQNVAVGEPYGDVIVVPHHAGREAHLATVVEYEMEHIIFSWHDGPKFDATATHINGGHPLIPDCPGTAVGLVSRPFKGLCMGAMK